MLGAIIGDIVGSRFEFNNHRSKEFELFTTDCAVTDDTVMTLAVAKAIIETELQTHLFTDQNTVDRDCLGVLSALTMQYMQELGRRYPNVSYGGKFSDWLFSNEPQPYHSFGNGAAMRVSPAGFIARNLTEVASLSAAVTSVTHNHPEGLKGAEATAVAIFLAREGATKDEIRKTIEEKYYPLDFSIDEIRPGFRFDETCQGTVPQAIQAFLESDSFEDSIRIAISLGGDSDTIAAITGAIAQAYYGIPDDIHNKALSFLNDDLRAIFNAWEDFAGLCFE